MTEQYICDRCGMTIPRGGMYWRIQLEQRSARGYEGIIDLDGDYCECCILSIKELLKFKPTDKEGEE